MLTIDLPKVLNMPDKMLKMVESFKDYRYFLAEGGRGGGKSQGIARFLLFLAETHGIRICCGRETQNTIDESVYTILRDIILEYNLNFEVFSNKIVHRKTESSFIFKGFREQGAVNVKGLEGIDILWIDESQAVAKRTLDVIIPTIRKENSKVIFSMNRYLNTDAVYNEFVTRKDCLHININYMDNPFCSRALLIEAEHCKETNEQDYNHIWLGLPVPDADNYLYNAFELEKGLKAECLDNPASHGQRILGVDIARYGEDSSVAVVIEKQGTEYWSEICREKWDKKDLMDSTGRIMDLRFRYKPDVTVIDGDGMGAGVVDRLNENIQPDDPRGVVSFRGGLPIPKDKRGYREYANQKTAAYYLIKEMLQLGRLRITSKDVIKDLEQIRFEYSSSGIKRIIPKEKMRDKYKAKSPDNSDALMMAISEVSNIYKAYEANQAHLPKYAIGGEAHPISNPLPREAVGSC